MSRSFALTAAALTLPLALAACGNSSDEAGGTTTSVSSTSSSSSTSEATPSSSGSSSSSTASESSSSTGSVSSTGSARSTASSSTSTSSASNSSHAKVEGHVSVAPSTKQAKAPTPTTVKKSALESTPASKVSVTTSDGGPQTGAGVTTQSLVTSVNGSTLTYTYSASGSQHLYRSQLNSSIFTSPNSRGVVIDFGDGSETDGADLGPAQCMPKSPLAPFSDKLPTHTHTYAAPGTYTVTTTTYYCGDSGPASKSTTQKVTIN